MFTILITNFSSKFDKKNMLGLKLYQFYKIKFNNLMNNIQKLEYIQYNLFLTMFIIVIFMFFLNLLYSKTYTILIVNFLTLLILIFLAVLNFYLTIRISSNTEYINYILILKNIKFFKWYEHFTISINLFGSALLLLCLITTLICLILLTNKNLINWLPNFCIFSIFFFFIIIMISSTNLLLIIISFEMMFLPTIYFIYYVGYTKKIDKACEYLFYWTLFGAFLVLFCIAYIYGIHKTLNYFILINKTFTKKETIMLHLLIFLGLGVKIPIFPFQFWLLKVHVEAPTAFSIFLSGFLVKSALYCFYIFNLILSNHYTKFIIIIWALISSFFATLGFLKQEDLKRLIAWATIQEMSLMLLFIAFKQCLLNLNIILFIIMHGILSSYMFYIVDIIQKRYNSRLIYIIQGISLYFPKLTVYIWILLIFFMGFPLTVKFFIEMNLIHISLETHYTFYIILIILLNYFSVIFFCKIFFSILYSTNKKIRHFNDITNIEKHILQFLLFLLFLLTYFFYLF